MALTHLGGASPGLGDMATMGQPGKYTFCFGEGEHRALPSLAERRGLPQAAITVFAASGTVELLLSEQEPFPAALIAPLAQLIRATATVAGGRKIAPAGEHVVLLPPEILDRLVRAGLDWADLREMVAAACGASTIPDPELLIFVCTGGIGEKMTVLQPWGGATRSVTRQLI